MGPTSLESAPSCVGSPLPSNTCFLGPTESSYIDLFSRFCRAHEHDNRQTDRPPYSVCSSRPLSLDAMRSNNKSSAVAEKRRYASVIHYIQHCHGTVRFIIYNTDVNERKRGERILTWHSKSSCYYSTVESTLRFSVTSKTQPTYESFKSCKQQTQLLQRDREPCIVSLSLVNCC